MSQWRGSIRASRAQFMGFSSVERVDEALDIKGKEPTAEEEKYLEELYEASNIARDLRYDEMTGKGAAVRHDSLDGI